jgi:site-specific recombinase XerD
MCESTAPPPPSFPSLVQQFFTDYLVTQRALSPCTIASYRDAWMLFLDFTHKRLGKLPTALRLADIEPDLILAFLDHHTIRHSTAMHLLQSGVALSVIALWLGHESTTTTHRYVEANLEMKAKALARLQEPDTKMRRYRPPDDLMKFLQAL